MHERVASEINMLKQRYPLLQHGDNLSWILIPDFILPPDRYNKEPSFNLKSLAIIPYYPMVFILLLLKKISRLNYLPLSHVKYTTF